MTCGMKKGDLVRIVGVPPGLRDEGDLPSKRIFDLCLGRIFPIARFQGHLLELEVGHVVGELAYMHSIWIESEFVEFVGRPSSYEHVSPASAEPADWPKLPQHVSVQVDTFPESSYGATTVTLVLSNGRRIERVVIGGQHIVRIGDRDITHAEQLGFDVSSVVAAERSDSIVSKFKTYLSRLLRGN
jgi:hypothetical protein